MGRPAKGVTAVDRFWFYVNRAAEDACWEWKGKPNPKGYGRLINESGRKCMAHRMAWELAFGPVPDGQLVLHKCDNPPCCNPSHLFLGDNLVNVRDKEAKGRGNQPKGESHFKAKLTGRKVRTIRALYRSGEFDQYELAEIYNMQQGTISKIIRLATWRHLND